MEYKVFDLKDLLVQIQYEGARKGTKTAAYLEDVIRFINLTKKYKWVQFFQLVDIFYVVVEILPSQEMSFNKEIKNHYGMETDKKEEESISKKLQSKPLAKGEFPWKNNKK